MRNNPALDQSFNSDVMKNGSITTVNTSEDISVDSIIQAELEKMDKALEEMKALVRKHERTISSLKAENEELLEQLDEKDAKVNSLQRQLKVIRLAKASPLAGMNNFAVPQDAMDAPRPESSRSLQGESSAKSRSSRDLVSDSMRSRSVRNLQVDGGHRQRSSRNLQSEGSRQRSSRNLAEKPRSSRNLQPEVKSTNSRRNRRASNIQRRRSEEVERKNSGELSSSQHKKPTRQRSAGSASNTSGEEDDCFGDFVNDGMDDGFGEFVRSSSERFEGPFEHSGSRLQNSSSRLQSSSSRLQSSSSRLGTALEEIDPQIKQTGAEDESSVFW